MAQPTGAPGQVARPVLTQQPVSTSAVGAGGRIEATGTQQQQQPHQQQQQQQLQLATLSQSTQLGRRASCGELNCPQEEQIPYPQYPPVTFFYLKQTVAPRKWCLAVVSNKYPAHSQAHTHTHLHTHLHPQT